MATQLGMCASSFFCLNPLAAKPVSQPVCGSSTLVVCHHGNTDNQTIVTSRRFFAVAAGFATTLGVFSQPQAAEAKRNKPPPEEKKVEEEDKSLSAYDARLLANARRKEAMKENIDKLKAKASAGTFGTANSTGTAETAETAS